MRFLPWFPLVAGLAGFVVPSECAEPSTSEPVPFVSERAPLSDAERTPKDSYRCRDTAGAVYKIRLATGAKTLVIQKGGFTQIVTLSEPNFGLPTRAPGSPVVFVGLTGEAQKPESVDLSTEVVTHFYRRESSTEGTVSVVVDHAEPKGLQCIAAGYALTVTTNDERSLVDRIIRPLADTADLRDDQGQLQSLARLGAQAMVMRYLRSRLRAEPGGIVRLLEPVTEPLRKIEPVSTKMISESLSPEGREVWASLLEKVSYATYPAHHRYAKWIQRAAQRKDGDGQPDVDLDSIRTGLNLFAKAGYHRDPKLKKEFLSDVTPALKMLSSSQREILKGEIAPVARALLIDAKPR